MISFIAASKAKTGCMEPPVRLSLMICVKTVIVTSHCNALNWHASLRLANHTDEPFLTDGVSWRGRWTNAGFSDRRPKPRLLWRVRM